MTAARTVSLSYPRAFAADATADGTQLTLPVAERPSEVGFSGVVDDVAIFRDAMSTLLAIKSSDLRYKGRDRAAYLAYLMKKGKKATAAIWDAQRSFLEAAFRQEDQTRALDPIMTVHPDEVSFEVFSTDESAWARLAIKNEAFSQRTAAHGSTCVELEASALAAVESIPGYRPLHLQAMPTRQTNQAPRTHQYDVPHPWLRGFLQVQSAATLPSTVCTLAPIDLYNVLLQLRLHKAKNPPRGLRFELIPGDTPRVVVEPWELVLESHGPVFSGSAPRVARLFGRTRLAILQRLLPHATGIRVHLLGAGLPSFFVVDMPHMTLTMGLSGWTESSWASAVAFDALMPSGADNALVTKLHQQLFSAGPQTLDALVASSKRTVADVRAALQRLCLRGEVMFDIADGVFRPRSIFGEAVDDDVTAFGSEREREAHRLLEHKKGVQVTKLHDRGHDGIDVHGEVKDPTADRVYAPRFNTDVEGRVSDAWCSCPHFRRSAMREGPCAHMIALRVAFGRQRAAQEALRATPEGRTMIRAETRTLLRREAVSGQQTVMRVSLDDKVVRIEWGLALATPKNSRIWFDTDAEARDAYFQRLDALMADGFLDADRSLG